jgi:hypothetical protein
MEWQNHKKNNKYKVIFTTLIYIQQTTEKITLIDFLY